MTEFDGLVSSPHMLKPRVLSGLCGLVYGISSIGGYLMPNPLYTYMKYMISQHILSISFLNNPEFIFHETVK